MLSVTQEVSYIFQIIYESRIFPSDLSKSGISRLMSLSKILRKLRSVLKGNREKLISVLRNLDASLKGTKTADLLNETSDQRQHSKLENSGSEMKRLIRDGPTNGKSSVLVRNNKYDLKHEEGVDAEVLDLVMDAKLHIQEEQRLLEELRKHLNDVTQLQNGVINDEHSPRLLKFGGMTSVSLKIVGIERLELIVEVGTGSEDRKNPRELADVLANELELLSQRDSDNSPVTIVLHGELEKCEFIVKQIEHDLQTTAVALQQNKQGVDIANMMLLVGSLVGGVMFCLAVFLQHEEVAFEFIVRLSGAGEGLLVGCTIGYIVASLQNVWRKRILFKQLFDKIKPNVDLLTTIEKQYCFTGAGNS